MSTNTVPDERDRAFFRFMETLIDGLKKIKEMLEDNENKIRLPNESE